VEGAARQIAKEKTRQRSVNCALCVCVFFVIDRLFVVDCDSKRSLRLQELQIDAERRKKKKKKKKDGS
jgi:hypothetical protein